MPITQKTPTTAQILSTFTEDVQDTVAALLVAGTNVTLTYNDPANTLTIASSGPGGGSGAAPDYPYHATILPTTQPTAVSPSATVAYQSGAWYAAVIGAGVNVNNFMEWDIVCAAGTYLVRVLHVKGSNAGIGTVSIDGTDVGTFDTYNSGFLGTGVADIAGAVITTGGRHAIRVRAVTKNAASSNYDLKLSGIMLTRTGA